MLELRKMKGTEFQKYRDIFITEYEEDLIKNHNMSPLLANQKATKIIDYSFPDGSVSNDKKLLCIELLTDNKKETIGYIWYNILPDDNSVFVLDFYIYKKNQNKGYGQGAIKALENLTQKNGHSKISLRVAPENNVAIKVYKKVGFVTTGINMSKSLQK